MNVANFIARRVITGGLSKMSSIIVWLAVGTIALSVSVMIISTSLIAGFQNTITEKMFGFWGHITVRHIDEAENYETKPFVPDSMMLSRIHDIQNIPYISENTVLGFTIKEDATFETKGGIKHIQSYAVKAGVIKSGEQMEGIVLKGIGEDYNWDFLNQYIIDGKALDVQTAEAGEGIIISQTTAQRLLLNVGDKFTAHFIKDQDQLVRRFQVTGIYNTSLEEYDRKIAFVDIRKIRQLNNFDSTEVSGLELFVDDMADLKPIDEYIYYQILPPNLYAETLISREPNLFGWLELQDTNKVVILALMIIIAIINMTTCLIILILERTNMIGILKALGARDMNVQSIFMYYAAYIIGIGLFIGNILGLGLCWLQDTFQFIQLDETAYYVSSAPIEINFWTVLLINIGTLITVLAALFLPSLMTLFITPLKAIRFD